MTRSALQIRDVKVTYGGLVAVDGVSFDVPEGEVLGMVGPNGAGKTTVLNCISGLTRPVQGTISMRDRRIDGLRPHRVTALGVGRTFQNAQFFKDFTAAGYVMLGMFHRARHRALTVAVGTPAVRRRESTDLDGARQALSSFGLEAVADVLLRELPYGVQRLVDVARAMASSPSVLLLDEPTSGMVSSERERLVDVIGSLSDSRVTTVIVDHDIEFVKRCCRSAVAMSHGSLLFTGTPEEMLKTAEVRAALLGQVEVPAP